MHLASWRQPPLTEEESNLLFMLLLESDEEDSPWMVMGDLQFWSATGFAHSLRNYAREQRLAWYVAGMLPIEFDWPGVEGRRKLAPDTFVSFVHDHPRTSYDLTLEGVFPAFVLEVVSPSSTKRDQNTKRYAYEMLGAKEYALFTPRADAPSRLEGYRRGPDGRFETWPLDDAGRLWSDVLGLFLRVQGASLYAQAVDGRPLLSPQQEMAARRRAEEAQQRAEEAQQRAEDENEHLRREVERLRYSRDDGGT
jgi:Uma2 family endonuclease